jgi:CheY-like chemotaxis protein
LARKVLLADDSVTAQNMGRKILTDAGYEVVTVNNGSAALKKVTEVRPDLIVLDVYMPGYSGLEVCQRIKESRETAQIPVLLTVGKLEPFKQDEARRVRADAFIIKPFEASELTAALAKLESRVGPVTSSRKESRPPGPATMEGFERTAAARGSQYGDEESGWKSRIKFPSGGKPPQPEPEPEIETFNTANGSFRELISEKPPGASATVERPIPAGLPQDITPDEIAALAAAAARVKSGISVGKNFERLTDELVPSKPPEEKALADAAKSADPGKAEPALPVVAVAEPVRTRELADTPAAAPSMEASSQVEPEAETQNKSSATLASADVQSVLSPIETATASAPTTTRVPEPDAADTVSTAPRDIKEVEPVTLGAIGPDQEVAPAPPREFRSSRRWIAEEIPVNATEAAVVLEREMHKAYAAFAAAEHGQSDASAPVDRDDEPMFATMAPPAIGTPLPVAEAKSAAETLKEEPRSTELRPSAAAASVAPPQVSGVSKATDLSKPPAPPFAPAGPSRDDSHAVVAFGAPELMGSTNGDKTLPVAPNTSAESVSLENRPMAEVPSATPAIAGTEAKEEPVADVRSEAELATTAAAWANWQDAREPVLGPKAGAEDVPAKAANPQGESEDSNQLKELKKVEPAPSTAAKAAMAAAASADASASSDPDLSNIVDNMLAELKPKLMAELAEKLKKEKTKK